MKQDAKERTNHAAIVVLEAVLARREWTVIVHGVHLKGQPVVSHVQVAVAMAAEEALKAEVAAVRHLKAEIIGIPRVARIGAALADEEDVNQKISV